MEAEGEASASQVSESAAQQQRHLGQIINQGTAAFLHALGSICSSKV